MSIDVQIAVTQTALELDEIANDLELTRHRGEETHPFVTRLNHQVDMLIRKHARAILALMNIHDRIAKLVP